MLHVLYVQVVDIVNKYSLNHRAACVDVVFGQV